MKVIIFQTANGECGKLDDVHYCIARDHFLFELEMTREIERLRNELARPMAFVEPITGPG